MMKSLLAAWGMRRFGYSEESFKPIIVLVILGDPLPND
jgi:hypothetical protein